MSIAVGGYSAAVGTPRGESSSVVNIDGARYYIHTIADGETLYSLAKEYGVTTNEIYDLNPSVRNGYKIGASIKIPHKELAVKNLSDKKLLKVFDIHSVVGGETIYSISRKYEISVDMILDDNPTVDPAGLAVGQSINIRKSEQGLTSAQKSMTELDDYRQQLNKLQEDGLVYHLVAEGETLESLSHEFDMVEGEIEDLNDLPEGQPLTVGSLVLVNDLSYDKEVSEYGEQHFNRGVVTSFSALHWGNTLKVSLLLPLSIRGYAMKPIVEFYQGFLQGVEELQNRGRNIEVYLFNTERSQERVAQIVASEEFLSSDLIVGPVYEELMGEVLASAESRRVPVVSPLAAIKQSDSEVLFQVAPVDDRRYEKLGELLAMVDNMTTEEVVEQESYDVEQEIEQEEIEEQVLVEEEEQIEEELSKLAKQVIELDSLAGKFFYEAFDDLTGFESAATIEESDKVSAEEEPTTGRHRITLIYGDSNDEAYREKIEGLLLDYNKSYECFSYSYEHPSAITERERKLDEYTKMIREEAKFYEYNIDTVALAALKCYDSKSNLTQLITNGAESNIFFVLSDKETEVDRILSALASAYTTLASTLRGTGIKPSEEFNFSVVANPAWRSYDNIDRSIFFRDRAVNFPSYLASRDSEAVRVFDSRYCELYDDFPSLYSYRGYDVASIFCEGMFGDIQYGLEGRTYTPLQTLYRFESDESQLRRANTNWMRVRYMLDYTLSVE